jgi:hypothetical protein
MNIGKKSVAVKIRRRLILLSAVLTLGIFTYRVLRSGVPDDSPATPDSPAAPYIGEFTQDDVLSHSFPAEGLPAPNNRWKFLLEREISNLGGSGYCRAKIIELGSGHERVLFTFWDADPGSGCLLGARWSSDSKAIHLAGETPAFGYWSLKSHPFDFHFIYLVDTDKIFRLSPAN